MAPCAIAFLVFRATVSGWTTRSQKRRGTRYQSCTGNLWVDSRCRSTDVSPGLSLGSLKSQNDFGILPPRDTRVLPSRLSCKRVPKLDKAAQRGKVQTVCTAT